MTHTKQALLQERAPRVWGRSRRIGDPGRGGQRKAGGSKLRLPTQDTTTGRGNEGDKQQKKLKYFNGGECINYRATGEKRGWTEKKRPKVQNVDGAQMTVQFEG